MSSPRRDRTSQYEIEAAAAAMTSVGAAHGGDPCRVARGSQPVVDRGANLAALDRRLARPMMAGDQEHDAVAAGNRLVEAAVDCMPGAVEVHSVEVEDSVDLDVASAQPLIPAAIERFSRDWLLLRQQRCNRSGESCPNVGFRRLRPILSGWSGDRLSR
jgi:hypothetical protein